MRNLPHEPGFCEAKSIVKRLNAAGHQAVFAGGCVRDMLLGRRPKDYDIATSAEPDEVEKLFKKTKPVGKQFGVILVMIEGRPYEVATFRSESGYSDGRRPDSVLFADISTDARRRDFTINGMYYNPLSDEVIDTVGGREDLENRHLRTIGNPQQRFREDHLRLIRAVRFAARLDMEMDSSTEAAIKEMKERVNEIASERLSEELRTILTDKAPAKALRIMDELGLLTQVFPELASCKNCEQPKNYHPEGDVFVHSLLTVEKLGAYPDFEVALAALLHDIGKPAACKETPFKYPEHERIGAKMTRKICRRLKLTKKETDRIAWLVKRHMYFKDAEKMKNSTLRRLFAEEGFEQLCAISYADAMSSWGRTDHVDYVLGKRQELSKEEIKPQPLINGHDLKEAGFKPGPGLGKALDNIYDLQLEGEVNNREEALNIAKKMLREGICS